MASIANRKLKLQKSIDAGYVRIADLDVKIGQLMSRRVDNEEYIVDWLKEIAELDKLAQNLPNG